MAALPCPSSFALPADRRLRADDLTERSPDEAHAEAFASDVASELRATGELQAFFAELERRLRSYAFNAERDVDAAVIRRAINGGLGQLLLMCGATLDRAEEHRDAIRAELEGGR